MYSRYDEPNKPDVDYRALLKKLIWALEERFDYKVGSQHDELTGTHMTREEWTLLRDLRREACPASLRIANQTMTYHCALYGQHDRHECSFEDHSQSNSVKNIAVSWTDA